MTDLNATWNEQLRGPRMSEATGRVIFKYQMPVLEQFEMELPAGAEIIRVQDMDGMFWMWAMVNTNAPMEKRYFRAFKTGAKIPDGIELKYIGFCAIFVQMELGLYIFEETKVIDIPLSEVDPGDLRGIPTFKVNPEAGIRWFERVTEGLYMDPTATLGDLLADALNNSRKKEFLNQSQIDAIEAQGGFDEDDND